MPLMLPFREFHAACPSPVPLPAYQPLCCDFAQLQPYEPVHDQFQTLGIRFEGAIALQPSNPAFVDQPEAMVIMPIAGRSDIAVQFQQPKQVVGARVTGARQVTLTVFDRHQQPLAQQDAGRPQYLQLSPEEMQHFAQHSLELMAEEIARVEFYSDAPFVLHNFFCD